MKQVLNLTVLTEHYQKNHILQECNKGKAGRGKEEEGEEKESAERKNVGGRRKGDSGFCFGFLCPPSSSPRSLSSLLITFLTFYKRASLQQ